MAAQSKVASFPAPVGGWVANRGLATPLPQGEMNGAAVLENFFPIATGVILRRGSLKWGDELGSRVQSMFTYVDGLKKELFAATASSIYDVTDGTGAFPPKLVWEGSTAGDWVTAQYATAGGTFLVGVNGEDPAWIYDGMEFWPYVAGGVWALGVSGEMGTFNPGDEILGDTSNATGIVVRATPGFIYIKTLTGTFQVGELVEGAISGTAEVDALPFSMAPGLDGVDPSRLSYVFVYQSRLWFIERDTLNAWYLPVDQVGGTLTAFPMGGVFQRGGSLIWGQRWSLSSGGQGGLSDQIVFTSTEGEVVSYQGVDPSNAATWSNVGTYRIGRPLGKKAFIRAGGDLVVATTVGFVSLQAASQLDESALGARAISYPIEDAWAMAVRDRGDQDWQCLLWSEGQAVFIAPPTPPNSAPVVFAANSVTGKWCQITGWDISAMTDFDNRFMMGAPDGFVRHGWTTGADDGLPYTGRCLPLFTDLGAPASLKVAKLASITSRARAKAKLAVQARFNFNYVFPAPPTATNIQGASLWDVGIWDEAIWDATEAQFIEDGWRSVGGSGRTVSVAIQVTSATIAPLDVEIIRTDLTYVTAGIVT